MHSTYEPVERRNKACWPEYLRVLRDLSLVSQLTLRSQRLQQDAALPQPILHIWLASFPCVELSKTLEIAVHLILWDNGFNKGTLLGRHPANSCAGMSPDHGKKWSDHD